MSNFTHISPENITDNTFKLISKDWMLVTSSDSSEALVGGKNYNTMTASWGGLGFLWGKPVAFVFIRPQRHTFPFIERNSRLTLSFFDESYHPALSYCGTFSGRDVDKAEKCGITPISDENSDGSAVWFDEARLVLKTKKLYEDDIREASFIDKSCLSNYKAGDFHKMYICEIEDVLIK